MQNIRLTLRNKCFQKKTTPSNFSSTQSIHYMQQKPLTVGRHILKHITD